MRTGEAVVSPDFELQAVGAPYDQDGNQDQPFKSDTPQASSASELEPNTMPISEATFRAELQMEPRPNYTLSNAQRRLGDGEVGRYSVENATDMGNVRLPVEQAVARPSLTMNEPGSSDGNYQPISTVGTDESEAQPTSPMPKVSTVSSSSPSPGLCVDHDGDGWGWDGQHSCKSTAATARYPKCADGAASDSDDDGYGWEHYKTCLV